MKNIIFLAVQGAGKGTLAKELAKKYGYAHISTGDILRLRAAVGDKLGLEIKHLIDNGILVSDDIIFEAIEYAINKPDCENGYILDGIPRTLKQAKQYDELIKKLNKEIGIVINLTIPDEELIHRITARRVCKSCGKIYSTAFVGAMPQVEGVCDDCHDELIFRTDDQDVNAISKRIRTYHDNVKDIIDYYDKKGILYQIDSSETKKALAEIEKVIK